MESIASRLERLPISRVHYTILIVASFALLFDTLDSVVTGFVLATVRSLWHFPVAWIGIVSAIGTAGFLLGALVAGFLGDRFGRKTVIMYTLVLYSVFSVSRAISGNVGTLLVLNFFTWLFVGAESAIVPPYLSEIWPARERGKLNGWMMSFFAYGIALTPLWALVIIPPLGWQWAFILTAPFALLVGLVRRRLPESPRWLFNRGRVQEAEAALGAIESAVREQHGGELPAPAPTAHGATSRSFTAADLLRGPYKARSVMLWIAWFAEYGVLYAFLTFVPTLLVLSGLKVVQSFEYSVVIYLVYIPGYILGGYASEALDRKWAIIAAFLGTAICGTLFGLVRSDLAVIVFGGLSAFFVALASTAIYTYTPELYPTDIRATGMGVASAWGRAGSIVLLLLFGFFAVLKGRLFLFLVADVILAVAIVAVALVGPSTRRQPLEVTAQEVG